MTEEELFGFYVIVGYTSGGAPYGITMEEAEEQGLLEEDRSKKDSDNDLPF